MFIIKNLILNVIIFIFYQKKVSFYSCDTVSRQIMHAKTCEIRMRKSTPRSINSYELQVNCLQLQLVGDL